MGRQSRLVKQQKQADAKVDTKIQELLEEIKQRAASEDTRD